MTNQKTALLEMVGAWAEDGADRSAFFLIADETTVSAYISGDKNAIKNMLLNLLQQQPEIADLLSDVMKFYNSIGRKSGLNTLTQFLEQEEDNHEQN